MAKKRVGPRCHTYYVAVVDNDPYDSYAATSKAAARKLAMPDRGSKVAYWRVCTERADAGAARLPSVYRKGKRV